MSKDRKPKPKPKPRPRRRKKDRPAQPPVDSTSEEAKVAEADAAPSKPTVEQSEAPREQEVVVAEPAMAATADADPTNADPTNADPTKADGENATGDDADLDEAGGVGSFLLFTAMPSWLTSTIVHVIVLLVLALMTLPQIVRTNRDNELVLGDDNDVVENLEEFQDQAIDTVEFDQSDVSDMIVEDTDVITDDPIVSDAMDMEAAALKMDNLDPLSLASVTSSELGQAIGVSGGDALSGRGAASRARLVREGGGTPGSEAAVASALVWLKNHQMRDGGWSIDHKRSPLCQGKCPDIGDKTKARIGATALALLPYLGAGQTHKEGEYQDVVEAGLKFLLRSIRVTGPRGSLWEEEGSYYSHGLATIVICETYAMTRDKTLMLPAQSLVNEIVYAQDPIGGGWRYQPRQPGDTSVVGWQLMALKSAHMGYLNVPKQTIAGATHFLDSVQSKNGSNYGYQDPSENWRNSMAAVGLLCRMYLGWDKHHPSIEAGVQHLSDKGPDEKDIYYNYYATQVMRHYGGDEWKQWNTLMRDSLVNSQEKEGHRAGSWFFEGGNHANDSGGRLYCTAMATMILEVYYRHLPLYQEEASEDEFPL